MNVTRLAPAVLPAAFWLLAAAPHAPAADGKLMGTVTLNGKPLAEGKVTFHLPNDQFVGSKVKDGRFLVERVPAGKHRVTIEGKGVPAKYGSEDTSALTVEVKGDGEFDFDLK